jgi:transposase
LFILLFKTNFAHVPSAREIFESATSSFIASEATCPKCGANGWSVEHDSYARNLIDFDSKSGVIESLVSARRLKCTSCGGTHALLPDSVVPRRSYGIVFILKALKAYFFSHAVTKVCKKYRISSSTLYEWRDRYLSHEALDLGALVEDALLQGSRWMRDADDICRAGHTHDFFSRFGFPFLGCRIATNINSS